ncbi:hypothetical protein GCM10019017_51480 [Streptomyces showdoensis]
MRRGLVHALAWSLATGGAVTLSWWGVHTVLAGTVYDPPRALPIPSGVGPATGSDPVTSSTRTTGSPTTAPPTPPATTPPATPPATPPSHRPTRPASATSTPGGSGGTGTAPDSGGSGGTGNVKSYGTDGGRAVFDLGPSSAELVSATPESGWQMQVWKQTTWIRVTFTKGSREISVFCVWHDTAPRVEIDEQAI